MDTDGDNPGNTLICHTVLRAYLRCESQGGRAFLRLHGRISEFFAMQKHSKNKKCAISSPLRGNRK